MKYLITSFLSKIAMPVIFLFCLVKRGQLIAATLNLLLSSIMFVLVASSAVYFGFWHVVIFYVAFKIFEITLAKIFPKLPKIVAFFLVTSKDWDKAFKADEEGTLYDVCDCAAGCVSKRINRLVNKGYL